MTSSQTLAERVARGDGAAIARIAESVVRVRPDNLVERPWGGLRLAAYKGVALDEARVGKRFGEAFEIAADPTDPECAAHPSVAVLADGSEIALPALLAAAGDALLGAGFVRAHGARLPLVPKTLDIAQLLSVQAHPADLPELYVVIEADPGASIRVGFAREVDARELERKLLRYASMLAARSGVLRPGDELHEANDYLIGLLNEVPVSAGDVIWNASPATRKLPTPSADVHALGNTVGAEMLVLEVRKPGPTLRLWDHARLPARQLDIVAALRAMAPRISTPRDFRVTPAALSGHPGVERAVACGAFVVDLLRPTPVGAARPPRHGAPRTLHGVGGEVRLTGARGETLGVVRRGESVLVPAALAIGEVSTEAPDALAVLVTLGDGQIVRS